MGLVVRDSQGNLPRAQAIWYEHATNARIMELLAVRDGAILARGYSHVIIESDAKEIVDLCNVVGENRGANAYMSGNKRYWESFF
jgi:ribonuclease HI